MTEIIRVGVKGNPYPIYLGNNIVRSIGRTCRAHRIPEHVVILSDTNSAKSALTSVARSLRRSGFKTFSVTMPPGEQQKSPERAAWVHSALLREGIPRDSALIALGGGVVGDVGGYVASTYKRGVKFVQCPTTLLSQVDSSVGGKNGVNYTGGKNVVGTFHQPAFVLSDVSVLKTLPRREVITGLGEILKYPFVGDPGLLGFIEQNLDAIVAKKPSVILEVARRCLRIKTRLVARDEKEMRPRGRNLLNVGHTVGHALETLSRYRLHHGEAVFLGIITEASISVERGWLSGNQVDRLIGIYHRLRCSFTIQSIPLRSIMRFVSSRHQKFVLPGDDGRLSIVSDVSPDELRRGLIILTSL